MNKLLSDFAPVVAASKRQQITAYVRGLVQSGELAPGTRLPATNTLAKQWGAPVSTVQLALTPLVKEGLLARRPRLGTFVQEREAQLTRVGIYLTGMAAINTHEGYGKRLVAILRDALAEQGVQHSFWLDPRPAMAQDTPWPELIQAADTRCIQALIVPVTDLLHTAWLGRLPVPVAFGGTANIANVVRYDSTQMADLAMQSLADQGCRRVGIVATLNRGKHYADGSPHVDELFYAQAERAAARLGLELRPEWILCPPDLNTYIGDLNADHFGYTSIHSLWQQPEQPDGLFVFTDIAARGVILALMERQVAVPETLKLVLHRNAELGLLCPMPVTYLDASVTAMAEALIGMVQRQYRGEAVTTVAIKHSLSLPPARP